MVNAAGIALGYFVTSRLAYVFGVGTMLVRQDREQIFTRELGLEAGFRRFRGFAAFLLNNDGVAFVFACLLTRGTMEFRVVAAPVICGILLIVIGAGTKLWAAKRLGAGAYYWRDFFAPHEAAFPDPPGPYRFVKNPMYTLGYLHTYGLALILRSGPGLLLSLFAQLAILLFHVMVEKPHFQRLVATNGAQQDAA